MHSEFSITATLCIYASIMSTAKYVVLFPKQAIYAPELWLYNTSHRHEYISMVHPNLYPHVEYAHSVICTQLLSPHGYRCYVKIREVRFPRQASVHWNNTLISTVVSARGHLPQGSRCSVFSVQVQECLLLVDIDLLVMSLLCPGGWNDEHPPEPCQTRIKLKIFTILINDLGASKLWIIYE